MKTLLYIASGPYRPEYESLPYERIILVDLRRSATQLPTGSKVRYLRMNVLDAVSLLRKEGVKIDCLVTINEGLSEGGGSFAMLSDFMIGQLFPLFKERMILICNLRYYIGELDMKKIRQLDWGYKAKRIHASHPEFIDPCLFSSRFYDHVRYVPEANFGHVFKMERLPAKQRVYTLNQHLTLEIKHESIWSEEQELDAIGVSISCNRAVSDHNNELLVKDYFQQQPKAFSLRSRSLQEIIHYCEENEVRTLGVMPWLNGAYSEFIQTLTNQPMKHLRKIVFYHLGKNDLKPLKLIV
jgi:hypothetical protein